MSKQSEPNTVEGAVHFESKFDAARFIWRTRLVGDTDIDGMRVALMLSAITSDTHIQDAFTAMKKNALITLGIQEDATPDQMDIQVRSVIFFHRLQEAITAKEAKGETINAIEEQFHTVMNESVQNPGNPHAIFNLLKFIIGDLPSSSQDT